MLQILLKTKVIIFYLYNKYTVFMYTDSIDCKEHLKYLDIINIIILSTTSVVLCVMFLTFN